MPPTFERIPEPLHESVRAVIERVPQWADAHTILVAPLDDVISLNNTNYRVTVDTTDYLLRIAGDDANLRAVRRTDEQASAIAAAQAGVAPPVLYADPTGHMVTTFITGRHWEPAEFHEPAKMERVLATLQRLHAVTGVAADGDAARRIEQLLASADTLGAPRPPDTDSHLVRLHQFTAARRADPRYRSGLAHNDFWANNFLDDGEQLWLVDWEFSGDGDPMFDIATLCLSGRYTAEQQSEILRAFGYTEREDLRTLRDMQHIVFFFEGTWALVQHAVRGSADYDYQAHTARMFERLATWGK